jgi:hypothetical protein
MRADTHTHTHITHTHTTRTQRAETHTHTHTHNTHTHTHTQHAHTHTHTGLLGPPRCAEIYAELILAFAADGGNCFIHFFLMQMSASRLLNEDYYSAGLIDLRPHRLVT